MEEKNLIDFVFSWSISDICNQNLYKGKVTEIPQAFSSVDEYLDSFKLPLIEETHADLCSTFKTLSKAPHCRVYSIVKTKKKDKFRDFVLGEDKEDESTQNIYEIKYRYWGKDLKESDLSYEPKSGDLVAFTEHKPRFVGDLNGQRLPFTLGLVQGQQPMSGLSVHIQASKTIDVERICNGDIFLVYLTNMVTNMRIWSAINTKDTRGDNMRLIKNVLDVDPSHGHCDSCCSVEEDQSDSLSLARILLSSLDLDVSQKAAVLECIVRRECQHQHSLKLIWGPPGTGKTKTVAALLFVLLRLKCRTLTCAPTNIAAVGIASRVMALIQDNFLSLYRYRLGDVLLFGNKDRLKMDDHEEHYHVFLDNRVSILSCCLSGWIGCARSLINLLEEPQQVYKRFLDVLKMEDCPKVINFDKFKHNDDIFMSTMKEVHAMLKKKIMCKEVPFKDPIPFEEFFVKQYDFLRNRLIIHIGSLYIHYPTSLITSTGLLKMIRLVELLVSIQIDVREELNSLEIECLQILKSLPEEMEISEVDRLDIKSFCMKNAVLIFCTASTSCNLLTEVNAPLELLVVDEAAQLKECESVIPMQLFGLKHAILIGDEKQLPAMVQSEISNEAKMGRSLFERMVVLGIPKHLLDIQYRMHPSISLFPNKQFYQGKLIDGPNVIKRQYEKHFLEGPMFGSYSFIDIRDGNEDFGGYSCKNMVEIAVLAEIVERLFKASVSSRRKISIGCISPYKAQVHAMQKMLQKWNVSSYKDFSINVGSVDGFQGGEEDLIIISTVRCNIKGSIGFLSNYQRANVALTRARYGMWILGNATTMINSGSIWKNLVVDAKERGCYFSASDDDNLSKAIQSSLVELHQLKLLFKYDSPFFMDAKWKVHFHDDFIQTMNKLNDYVISKEVIPLLKRISTGWRNKDIRVDFNMDGTSCSELLEMYNVNDGSRILVWSVNVVQVSSNFIQVVQVWDIITPNKIPELVKKLDKVFEDYKVSMLNRCKTKKYDGELAIPESWPIDSDWRSSHGRANNSNWRSSHGRGNRGAPPHRLKDDNQRW